MEVINQEKIDELKAKLALLEGDRKAYFESAVHALAENKKRVADLRSENTRLRNVLKERLSADHHIINHVMHNRQADRACLANKSGADAIELMDYRTCDAMKKLNALKHTTAQKEKRIDDLKKNYRDTLHAIEESNATWTGASKEGKRLRDLENRLDKANLKYQEAEHIKKTYEQIKEKLQDEHLTYEHSLDALEKQIKATQDELVELQSMYSDAVAARDAAQQELKYQEENVANERRRREIELSSMKKIAEGKKISSEKNEAPLSGRESILSDDQQAGSTRGASANGADRLGLGTGAGISEEQQNKITNYEEAFKHIKEATGLSDLDQIVKRFESQGETLTHLNELKEKAELQCHQLRKQRDNLQLELEELKYSGETELTSVNQLLEQYHNEAEAEKQRREQFRQDADDASRLLVECKAGVDHIYEKLAFLNVTTTTSQTNDETSELVSKSQLPEMLKKCNDKLDELMTSLSNVPIEDQINLMEQEEFFAKLEARLPENNTRIQIPVSEKEPAHEEEDQGGDDNDILTRVALKRQAQQIVEMRNKKRQTKKKKRKSK